MSRPSKAKPAAPAPGVATLAPTPVPTAAAAPVDPAPVNTPQVAPDPTGAASEPASAAAKAAAAPVDPKPEAASPDPIPAVDATAVSTMTAEQAGQLTGPEGYGVKVVGPAKGRWRIGRKFGPEAVTIPLNELTGAQMSALLADPELNCVQVDLDD